ncbi:MAG: DNA polymerase IV [Acetobacteraceae bacterium]
MALAAVSGLPVLCRDCLALGRSPGGRAPGGAAANPPFSCAACGSLRIVRHDELLELGVAHIDCDAFFASVEKRDHPELAERAVIVGGGRRGVVAAACYVARLSGVRSAMPMFQALALCPEAVVLAPDFAKYAAAARVIRAEMRRLTPLVQPLSIDEAVLDLRGAGEQNGVPPAVLLAGLALGIEARLSLTVSIGLAPNRLLAKLAAGRDKPRGFAVIGAAEAANALAPLPVRALPGVGPVMERRLHARGINHLSDLQRLTPVAARGLGRDGPKLVRRAAGEDDRAVTTDREIRSISTERTFERDLADPEMLARSLWTLALRLGERLSERRLAAAGVALKLRTADFRTLSRHHRLPSATADADRLYAALQELLARESDGQRAFRLIGAAAEPLSDALPADETELAMPSGEPGALVQSPEISRAQ